MHIVNQSALPLSVCRTEFVGADRGGVAASFLLVVSEPGDVPFHRRGMITDSRPREPAGPCVEAAATDKRIARSPEETCRTASEISTALSRP